MKKIEPNGDRERSELSDTNNKPREFWINCPTLLEQNSDGYTDGNGIDVFINHPNWEDDFIHVIEKQAYDNALKTIENLTIENVKLKAYALDSVDEKIHLDRVKELKQKNNDALKMLEEMAGALEKVLKRNDIGEAVLDYYGDCAMALDNYRKFKSTTGDNTDK